MQLLALLRFGLINTDIPDESWTLILQSHSEPLIQKTLPEGCHLLSLLSADPCEKIHEVVTLVG